MTINTKRIIADCKVFWMRETHVLGNQIFTFLIVLVSQNFLSIIKTIFDSVQVGRKDIITYKYSKGIYSLNFLRWLSSTLQKLYKIKRSKKRSGDRSENTQTFKEKLKWMVQITVSFSKCLVIQEERKLVSHFFRDSLGLFFPSALYFAFIFDTCITQRKIQIPGQIFVKHLRKSLRFCVQFRDTLESTPKGVLMMSLYKNCLLFIIFTIISRLFNSFSIPVIILETNHRK